MLHLPDQLCITGPALVLVEQNEEQGRRVGGSEVRGVRTLLEGGHLAPADFVKDLSWLLIAKVVAAGALTIGEIAERGPRELRNEWQGLQARNDAVATERRHEPWQ